MSLPAVAVEHYTGMQRLQLATMSAIRTAWARMGADFDSSWRGGGSNNGVGRDLTKLLSAGQLVAAQAGAAMVQAVLAEQGLDDRPSGAIVAQRFSGVASDGRDLAGLLYGAVTHAKTAVGAGAQPPAALAVGGRFLDMAARTQVVDASRAAASVMIAATPHVGYIRMINPPCCGRCAILAGRFYRWSSGFERHPRCDCTMIASTEDAAGDLRTSPERLFGEGRVRGLSQADAQAISDGADPGQVVNAHRGMAVAQVYGRQLNITTEGTTKRGLASQARTGRKGPRVMPSSIYEIADDRDHAVNLLRLNGFIR